MFYIYNLIALLHSRVDDAKDRGATATEYAMLVALIAVAIFGAVTLFGTQLSDFFNSLGQKVGIISKSGS